MFDDDSNLLAQLCPVERLTGDAQRAGQPAAFCGTVETLDIMMHIGTAAGETPARVGTDTAVMYHEAQKCGLRRPCAASHALADRLVACRYVLVS